MNSTQSHVTMTRQSSDWGWDSVVETEMGIVVVQYADEFHTLCEGFCIRNNHKVGSKVCSLKE